MACCLLISQTCYAGLRGDSQFTYETGLIFADTNSGFSNFEAQYQLQGNSVIYQFDSQTEADINHDHTDQISNGLIQETRFYMDSPRSPISLLVEQDYDSGWDIGETPFEEWQHDVRIGPEIALRSPTINEMNLDVYFVDERNEVQDQQYFEATFEAEKPLTRRQDMSVVTHTRQLLYVEPLNEYELTLHWQLGGTFGYWSAHAGRHWTETDQIIDQSFIGSVAFTQMLNSAIQLRIGGQQSIEPANDDSPVPDSLFTENDSFYQLQDYWVDINWDQIEQRWFFHNQYSIGEIENRKTHYQSHEIVLNRPIDIGRVRPLETELGWTTLYESRFNTEDYLRHDFWVSVGQQTRRELLVQFNSRITDTPDQILLAINLSFQWTPIR